MAGAISGLLASYKIGSTQPVYVLTTPGFGNIIAPSGYTKVTVEGVGAGGSGFGTTTNNRAGGGGGAYAQTANLSVTGGSTVVYYQVGTGGTPNAAAATDSWASIASNAAPSSVAQGFLAKAGLNASASTAGTGGTVLASIGNTKFAGGNGSAGAGSSNAGGGGAGDTGAGGNAATATPGTGGTGTNITGGNGGGFNTAGSAPGGGGGGDGGTIVSLGARGVVRISFSN